MMRHWLEFVHIKYNRFKQGDHPWLDEEFYHNSMHQFEANHTTDPICMVIFDGIRVAESDGWWIDEQEMWSAWPLPLDDNYKLTEMVVRFSFQPLTTGTFNHSKEHAAMPPQGLIAYNMSDNGTGYVFSDIHSLMQVFNQYSKDHDELQILTIWECSAGTQYIPGEPDEYDETWNLIGVVTPGGDAVKYEEL